MKGLLKAKVKRQKAKVKKATGSSFYLGFFISETLTSRLKRGSWINGGVMVLNFLMVGIFNHPPAPKAFGGQVKVLKVVKYCAGYASLLCFIHCAKKGSSSS